MARGDHVFVERAFGLYAHHGIDCGDGHVIHFQGPDPLRARIVRSDRETFCAGAELRVQRDADPVEAAGANASADAIVARAESRLGMGGYDLLFNNCEHFATWCRTGRARSTQSEAIFVPATLWRDTARIALRATREPLPSLTGFARGLATVAAA